MSSPSYYHHTTKLLDGEYPIQNVGKFLAGDLTQNRPCLRRGISRFRDRPADHNMAGAGCNGLGWCDDADLISDAGSGWAHAGGNEREAMPQFCAQRRGLSGGGDYTLASVRKGDGSEA